MTEQGYTDGWRNHEYEGLFDGETEQDRELRLLRAKVALAYGYLWHVNNEQMAPVPMYSPEKAAYEARKVLRDTLTHEQRGAAICRVQALLGHNAEVSRPGERSSNGSA